jgi:hypothetical protein
MDTCPHCELKGLWVDEREKPGRRRCEWCHKEEPRTHDRVLYLACQCDIEWDHDDRRQRHRLGSWWSVEPFFDVEAAREHLKEKMISPPGRNYDWRPITVQGHAGVYTSEYGNSTFLFVDTKLVDVRPVLPSLVVNERRE